MTPLMITSLSLLAVSVIAALTMVLRTRRQMRQTLLRIDEMLDAAIGQAFSAQHYDESLLSSVEIKQARYLAQSMDLAQALTREKEKIKALMTDISHQTKTPLANVILYTQLLQEEALTRQSQQYVNELQRQSEKLNFLIQTLVTISRLETGVVQLAPEKQTIQGLVFGVLQQATPIAQAKGQILIADESSAMAVFDLKWTQEALYNIVDNALKYSPKNSPIRINVSAYEFFVRINVCDDGIGIDKAEQAAIFNRFYRSTAVQAEEGIGIGLYLAREILSAQGGYLTVQSELGKGTTFSMFLPQ